ncbi:MAG: M28 family metallopeptidase [Promethearchaeota archaeon]
MIDEKRIITNLEAFSFPRLSGTEGENKASNLALKKIRDLEIEPSTQEFTFSTFYSRVYQKIVFSLGFVLLFILFLTIKAVFFFYSVIIIFIIIIVLIVITRNPEKINFGRILNSRNVFVKLASISNNLVNKTNDTGDFQEDDNVILFMCHLDSKSQRLNIGTRIKSYRIWVFSALPMFIIIILKNFIYFLKPYIVIFYIIGIIPLILNFYATILIIINTTNNNSDGAIDNASGIAIVLELLNYYIDSKVRLKNYNLWFLFTGAEECGTMGIRHFYNNEIKKLDRKKSLPINFDAIGKNIYPFPSEKLAKTNNIFLNSFLKNGEKLNFKRNPKRIYFGSHSDGGFLDKKGFVGIGFGDMASYSYIHSINDTVDKVDTTKLRLLCEALTSAIADLDNHT